MIELITAPTLKHDTIAHGFTTRAGGVSSGAFESLNLSRREGEPDANVDENRKRVRHALGLNHLAAARQVHGNTVIRIDAPPADGIAGEGDAMITNVPGIGLMAQTADCVPLLLFDAENKAIAAVHSGWRGTVQEIAKATLVAMNEAYGTHPSRIHAAIGPSISAANYRVGPDVLAQFETVFGELDGLVHDRDEEGGAKLDNGGAVFRQLIHLGVNVDRIWWAGKTCTFADETLFSCRRAKGGPFGGQAGVIGLKP